MGKKLVSDAGYDERHKLVDTFALYVDYVFYTNYPKRSKVLDRKSKDRIKGRLVIRLGQVPSWLVLSFIRPLKDKPKSKRTPPFVEQTSKTI